METARIYAGTDDLGRGIITSLLLRRFCVLPDRGEPGGEGDPFSPDRIGIRHFLIITDMDYEQYLCVGCAVPGSTKSYKEIS